MKESLNIQKSKIGVAGSFFNQMMANNATLPEVGKGATELLYTDRRCYEVVEVSDDKQTAKLQYLNAKCNTENGATEGHQDWIFEPIDHYITVTWKKDSWVTVGTEIVFTKKFIDECAAKGEYYIGIYLRHNDPELCDKIYNGEVFPANVIEGITREKKTYHKIKLIFGRKDYYYDWSF